VGTDSHTLIYGALNCVSSGIATDEGFSGWNYDTICISPGRNQTLETAFNLDISPPAVTLGYGGTQQVGDDFIYVIAGSSR